MTIDLLVTGIKYYLVFVFSTTLHEAAHAWVGLKLGDDTAHRGGQVTLDPTPHIFREPIGMVVVPILSYLMGGWMIGWASAPYDPRWAVANPRRSALVSLAGPASNLLLVLLAAAGIRLGLSLHYFEIPDSVKFGHVVDGLTTDTYLFSSFLSIIFSLNLLLFGFNLLPFPPLDGSGALLFFANSETAAKIQETLGHPSVRMVGLLIAWKAFTFIDPPLQLFAINLLYPGVHYQ